MRTTAARPRAAAPADPPAPSRPGWPAAPAPGTRITEGYARMVAREAYFWAWPLLALYNQRLAFARLRRPGRIGGVMPAAPPGRLAMLADVLDPGERWRACPDQDVVHGMGVLALDDTPVVVQVPDFGRRFWVYEAVDLRTDGFAELGAMYGTAPGFYLLAGPAWRGEAPTGIRRVFQATTSTGAVEAQVFVDDTEDDREAAGSLLSGVVMYPLAEYDGSWKRRDWRRAATLPGDVDEVRRVDPAKFLERLPRVLRDAPPLPGEEAHYAEMLAVLAAAAGDDALASAVLHEVRMADCDVVGPLAEFRNYGVPLPHHWTTTENGAAFGADYFTRTAVGRSELPLNRPNEVKCFCQDRDAHGVRLNSRSRYEVTFFKGRLPPVRGPWSLALYDEWHFAPANALGRHSVGTRSHDLRTAADGSVTLYLQPDEPDDPADRANWLPSPPGRDFSLVLRAYWPDAAILDGRWTPPPVARAPA
ncbi:MAG TPA: DUF1214 domain-containing protein [Longimicrobium sp.]